MSYKSQSDLYLEDNVSKYPAIELLCKLGYTYISPEECMRERGTLTGVLLKGYAIIMTTHMPNHAIILGGKTAILNKSGELICGNTEEIVTDENLQEIYQVDVRVVDVKEAGGKVCVFVQDQAR